MVEKEAKRERSAAYPYASWSDCLGFIKEIDSFRASQVSYDEAARKCGVSAQAPSFKAKLSASKQFGLIETAGSVISLSGCSRKLLYPTGNDAPKIILECFANPPLYSKLIDAYNGKALPTEVVLGNILMSDYAIARNAKDTAARFFILNANEMGFVRAGVLTHSLSEDIHNISDAAEAQVKTFDDKALDATPISTIDNATQPVSERESGYITQIVPTESGKAAKIQIPLDATADDLWIIRDSLDIIMKRKFKIEIS